MCPVAGMTPKIEGGMSQVYKTKEGIQVPINVTCAFEACEAGWTRVAETCVRCPDHTTLDLVESIKARKARRFTNSIYLCRGGLKDVINLESSQENQSDEAEHGE
jgi:formate dehydrogenase maturation protein FdhE